MASAAPAIEIRPPRLVFVYTWDLLRGVGALLAALSAFGGGVDASGRTIAIPVWEQVIAGLASASYAAALFVIAALLARRQRWVQRAQIALCLVSAILIVASAAVYSILSPGDALPILVSSALFLALDAAAVMSLTRGDAHEWYLAPSATPKYISGTIAFWAAGSTALMVIDLLR